MLNYLSKMYFASKTWLDIKAQEFVERFKEDECGVSGFVAAIILVLFAVLLAAFFWDEISGLVSRLWAQITQNSDFKPIGS